MGLRRCPIDPTELTHCCSFARSIAEFQWETTSLVSKEKIIWASNVQPCSLRLPQGAPGLAQERSVFFICHFSLLVYKHVHILKAPWKTLIAWKFPSFIPQVLINGHFGRFMKFCNHSKQGVVNLEQKNPMQKALTFSMRPDLFSTRNISAILPTSEEVTL